MSAAQVSPRFAITLLFTLNGVMLGSWGARIPAIQDRLDVGPGALAIALACLAGGALIAMPAAGRVVATRGSATVLRFAVVTLGVLLVLPAVMPTLALVAVATFFVGVSNGAYDVAQNAQGVEVERRADKAIFSSMHAAFSFGGLVGAGLGAAAAALEISAGANFAVVGVAAALIGTAVSPALIDDGPPVGHDEPEHDDHAVAAAAAAQRAHVWPLRALAFCALFCEGAAMDWSAVHLRDIGATTAVAALGYGAFSVAMAAGRLRGDALVERLGPVTLARRGGALAAGAMAVSLIVGIPAVGLLSYIAIGAGLSVIIPLIFRAAASTGADAGPALAGVTTTGYLGLLSGPPIIGAVASFTSVPGALVLAVVAAAAVAFGAPLLRTPTPVPA
ncbi:MFS transporter [Baekduia sp. Peel2402]|uniref:MFS transporter n=1 Tax=Baekduia sp. Peel2402 TaxID=3458296 RepID=UPI00403E3944